MPDEKSYCGDRTIDGSIVTVNGAPLDARLDIKTYTDHGFEWGYEGDGPSQLALAILADHLGEGGAALAEVDAFMRRVVANFGNEWEMTSADVRIALENIHASA